MAQTNCQGASSQRAPRTCLRAYAHRQMAHLSTQRASPSPRRGEKGMMNRFSTGSVRRRRTPPVATTRRPSGARASSGKGKSLTCPTRLPASGTPADTVTDPMQLVRRSGWTRRPRHSSPGSGGCRRASGTADSCWYASGARWGPAIRTVTSPTKPATAWSIHWTAVLSWLVSALAHNPAHATQPKRIGSRQSAKGKITRRTFSCADRGVVARAPTCKLAAPS